MKDTEGVHTDLTPSETMREEAQLTIKSATTTPTKTHTHDPQQTTVSTTMKQADRPYTASEQNDHSGVSDQDLDPIPGSSKASCLVALPSITCSTLSYHLANTDLGTPSRCSPRFLARFLGQIGNHLARNVEHIILGYI